MRIWRSMRVFLLYHRRLGIGTSMRWVIGMYVGDIAFDIEVTFVDIVKFLLKVLINEFVSI